MLARVGPTLIVLLEFLAAFAEEVHWHSGAAAPGALHNYCRSDAVDTCAKDACKDGTGCALFGRPWPAARKGVLLFQRNQTTIQRVAHNHWRSAGHPLDQGGFLHPDQNVSLLEHLDQNVSLLEAPDADFALGNPDAGNPEMQFEPVSTTLRCVMFLTLLLLLCYVVLSVLRNSVELSEVPNPPRITDGFEVAVRSASHGAALGTLFVGMRMYVLASTGGKGTPQDWVQGCMVAATAGVTLQIIVALLLPYLMKEPKEGEMSIAQLAGAETDAHPRLASKEFKSNDQYYLAVALQALAIIAIYGGSAGVVAGVVLYEPPTGTKLPVSPAVTCVILLDAVFLLNQLHLFIMREVGGEMGGVIVASIRARKAPMLAVLFLAARMRNLQTDPAHHGLAPFWMKVSFYTVVVALFCEMTVSAFGGRPRHYKKDTADEIAESVEEVIEEVKDAYHPQSGHPCVHLLQQVFAACIFVALGFIMDDIWTSGGEKFPLSTTMKCVMLLSALFFTVHVFQWFASFSTRVDKWGDILQATALSAGVAVSLCPMLGILFVGCRVRALQLTNMKGAPQWWAQDAMNLDVFAIFIQVFCCLALPAFTGAATTVDGDGNAKYDLKPMIGAYAVQIIKYVALLALYSGVTIVCVGIFKMYEGMKDESNVSDEDMYKKILANAITVLVIFLVASLLSSAKVIGLIIKWAIESADETFLGVQITVGKAALSLLRGYVFLSNLIVENPEGQDWASPCLLKIGKLVVKVNIWRIITSGAGVIEINALVLTGVEVNYEKAMFKHSNVQMLIDFLAPPAAESSKPVEKPPPPPKKEEKPAEAMLPKKQVPTPADDTPPPEIILELLQVGDIGANVWNSHAGRILSLVLGSIKHDNFQEHFGGKATVLVGDIIGVVLKTILNTVLANAKNIAMEVANLGKFVGRKGGCGNCLPCIPAKGAKALKGAVKEAEAAQEQLDDQ
mmetsp:Transcript_148867/g.277486  ORF Transcript_148867/g.277486 Transcript_148867/m.277486 type:complete len:958 (-) Transcript_148867:159-3032(-)